VLSVGGWLFVEVQSSYLGQAALQPRVAQHVSGCRPLVWSILQHWQQEAAQALSLHPRVSNNVNCEAGLHAPLLHGHHTERPRQHWGCSTCLLAPCTTCIASYIVGQSFVCNSAHSYLYCPADVQAPSACQKAMHTALARSAHLILR